MLTRTPSSVLLALTSLALPIGLLNDWFVDQDAPSCPTATGGPQDPFCTIQRAIDNASDGDRVLIAPGTYLENLVLAKDLDLIGVGGRDVTVVNGRSLDRVLVVRPATTGSVTGLTMTNGDAYTARGGGILLEDSTSSAPTIFTVSASALTNNVAYSGGAIQNGDHCTLDIIGCDISGNDAINYFGAGGGGIYSDGTLTIAHSTISGNRTSSPYSEVGVAIRARGPCTIENTLIVRNDAGYSFHSFGNATTISVTGPLVMRNSTVALNGTRTGQDCLVAGFNTLIEHCIFRGNAGDEISTTGTVNYSCIDHGWSGAGTGNIGAAPQFVDPTAGNFELQQGSPCIDAGDPRARPAGVDHDGNPRVLDGRFDRVQRLDMGYVEFANVRLSAEVLPTHELTLSTPGSASGLTLFLIGGFGAGQVNIPPWGPLFVDPGTLALIEAIGTTPTTQTYAIPPSLFGTDVVLQLLALGAPLGSGRRPGNFSNAVALTLE